MNKYLVLNIQKKNFFTVPGYRELSFSDGTPGPKEVCYTYYPEEVTVAISNAIKQGYLFEFDSLDWALKYVQDHPKPRPKWLQDAYRRASQWMNLSEEDIINIANRFTPQNFFITSLGKTKERTDWLAVMVDIEKENLKRDNIIEACETKRKELLAQAVNTKNRSSLMDSYYALVKELPDEDEIKAEINL